MWIAVVSAGTLTATAFYRAGRDVTHVEDLVGTWYGRGVLAEAALIAFVGALGMVISARLYGKGRRGLHRSAASDRPPAGLTNRLVAVEAVAGLLLLLALGSLVQARPGNLPVPALAGGAAQAVSGSVADLSVSVSITPNVPGPNGFAVLAASSRRPSPAAIDNVLLEFVGGGAPRTLRLQRIGPNQYFGADDLRGSGPAQVTVIVERSGIRFTIPLSWRVTPVPIAPPRKAQLAPITNQLALIVAGGTLLAAVWWLLVARPRRHAVDVALDLSAERRVEARVLEGSR